MDSLSHTFCHSTSTHWILGTLLDAGHTRANPTWPWPQETSPALGTQGHHSQSMCGKLGRTQPRLVGRLRAELCGSLLRVQQISLLWWEIWTDTHHRALSLALIWSINLLVTWVKLERSSVQTCGWTSWEAEQNGWATVPGSQNLNRLEPWDDPKRWCLTGTVAGPLAVSWIPILQP